MVFEQVYLAAKEKLFHFGQFIRFSKKATNAFIYLFIVVIPSKNLIQIPLFFSQYNFAAATKDLDKKVFEKNQK